MTFEANEPKRGLHILYSNTIESYMVSGLKLIKSSDEPKKDEANRGCVGQLIIDSCYYYTYDAIRIPARNVSFAWLESKKKKMKMNRKSERYRRIVITHTHARTHTAKLSWVACMRTSSGVGSSPHSLLFVLIIVISGWDSKSEAWEKSERERERAVKKD